MIAAPPRRTWLGYTLGYRIAGDWLALVPVPDGDAWISVPPSVVLAAARDGVLAEDKRREVRLPPDPDGPRGWNAILRRHS